MSRHRSTTITALRHSLWLAAGLLVAPAVAAVQTTPATASSAATTDMSSMPGMDMSHSSMSMPAASASVPTPAAAAKARKRRRKPSAKPVHHMPATSHGATAPRIVPTVISARVAAGNSAPACSKIGANCGSTYSSSSTREPIAAQSSTAG